MRSSVSIETLETLELERRGHVWIVRLNRPSKMNAMSPRMFSELQLVMGSASDDWSVHAIVLTGSGKAFSAGADINTFEKLQDDAEYHAQLATVEAAFRAVEDCAVPVIAAVNGPALAGGLEILLFCDFVLAVDVATFGFSEILVGLQPVYGLSRGSANAGRNWIRYLAYTGESLSASTALSIGIVQKVLPTTHSLMMEAMRIANRIAALPTSAVREGKRLEAELARVADLSLTIAPATRLFADKKHKEAVQSFLRQRRSR